MSKKEDVLTMKREISGFGGGYEKVCREMLVAGLDWLEKNPKANPLFHGFKGIVGVIAEDNKDADELSKAVLNGRDCTGAMHDAVISHILYIKNNSLDKYLETMNKNEEERCKQKLKKSTCRRQR